MGLSSFFTALRGSRIKENIVPQPRWEIPMNVASPATRRDRGEYVYDDPEPFDPQLVAYSSAVLSQVHNESRRSRRRNSKFTLPKSNSLYNLRERRSWFGGRPDSDLELPPVPVVVNSHHHKSPSLGSESLMELSETMLEDPTRRSQSHSHSHSQDTRIVKGYAQSISTRSQFTNPHDTREFEALSALPPMPTTNDEPKQRRIFSSIIERRRSCISLIDRSSNTKAFSVKMRSRSLCSSFNPNDSTISVPPVPALIRDGSSDAGSNNSGENLGYGRHPNGGSGWPGHDGLKRMRSIDTKSRHKHKASADGDAFSLPTPDSSKEAWTSHGQSGKTNHGPDLSFLSEKQHAELARLMNGETTRESHDSHYRTSQVIIMDEKAKYANAQALAALEFGLRS